MNGGEESGKRKNSRLRMHLKGCYELCAQRLKRMDNSKREEDDGPDAGMKRRSERCLDDEGEAWSVVSLTI